MRIACVFLNESAISLRMPIESAQQRTIHTDSVVVTKEHESLENYAWPNERAVRYIYCNG